MSFDADTLYNLLPAIYRIRDAERGKPLKALLTVLAGQVAVLEEDLAQLYDDQFIETCAEWVVPYIGDLIGDRALYSNIPNVLSSRAAVANTIGYRRRKGTASMLEQLAHDVTGWYARVVEFFQLLATTQYMNHLRPTNLATPDLRHWQPLEYSHTPFETTAHTAEMRRIASQRGRYNIPNIGIFLWRLQPYRITRSTARAVANPSDGRYTFNPVGLDVPLFNFPKTEKEFTHLAEPINVPDPLRRRVLYEELEAWRQAIVDEQVPNPVYFENEKEVFNIFLDNQDSPIPSQEILICDLTDWRRPPTSKAYRRRPVDPDQSPQALQIQVAVDPVLGRITFPTEDIPDRVEINYTYGFSADVGGGPYDRGNSVFPVLTQTVTWQRGVTLLAPANEPELVTTLTEAINDWNSQPAGTVGVIAILDSRTYSETFPTIQIPERSQLILVAANWPLVEVPDDPAPQRLLGQLSPEELRPHLLGNLSVEGTASISDPSPGELILNGLLIEGSLEILPGNLDRLQISHCTWVPGRGTLTVDAPNPSLNLWIDHSICSAITVSDAIAKLQIVSSIVDGDDGVAITASTTDTNLQTSTILGGSTVQTLEASNSIFTDNVMAMQRQVGCVRFSSLPLSSQVPRRYCCQPNLALAEFAKTQGKASVEDLSLAEQTTVQRRVAPLFTSRTYGAPGYCQLSRRCAVEIRQGADDEAEMGVFHDLFQPQREINLRVRLNEYLRFNLEAGIFYIT